MVHFRFIESGFSLGRLHMEGGGQVQGDKALMGGGGGHRPYGGDLTWIDYIIN